MNKGVIAIWVHNSLEYVKMAVGCLRYYGNLADCEIVLLISDDISEIDVWAKEQHITCLCNKESQAGTGALMNQVINMSKDQHVLFMDDSCMIVPGTISKLLELLGECDDIGAVGPISNAFEHFQFQGEFESYEKALSGAGGLKKQAKEVLAVAPDFFVLSGKAIQETGLFDESLTDIKYITQDYFLRMFLAGWKIKVCESAYVWSFGLLEHQNSFDESRMEEKWGMHYFNALYNDNLLELIEEERDAHFRVLEIGCDCGATLLEIKNRYPNAEVYGSEINESAAKVAAHIAAVKVNNIEECDLDYEEGFFDYIIFGDVLEHLRSPLKVITYCRELLNEKGCILASIPNLMHITVMERLLHGQFTYTETGLLDKTHIHLFTYNEIIEMFQKARYEVENVLLVWGDVGAAYSALIDELLKLGNAQRFMYETFQYAVRARK